MARTNPTRLQTHEPPRVVSTLSAHQGLESSRKQNTDTGPEEVKSPISGSLGFLRSFPAYGRHTRLKDQALNDIFQNCVLAFVAH